MRRLFLHIGAHKTGTTALQQSLHRGRSELRAQGAEYVSAPDVAHLHAYLGNAEPVFLPQGYILLDPEGLIERFAAAERDLVIGSSENFSFFFQRPAIVALEAALRPLFDEINIVCYLRRQDRHAVSHHQEGAKPNRRAEGALWGHALTALPVTAAEQGLYLDYERRLGLWAEVFGAERVDLRVYDRALLKDGDILADFLDVIGLEVPGLASVGERNASLGAAQSKAGHLMNGLGVRPKMVETVLAGIVPEGRLLPSRAEARAFLEPFLEGNRRLAARFGGTGAADFFGEDFEDYPEEAQSDWSEAGATSALRAALGQMAAVTSALEDVRPEDLRAAAQALKETAPEVALRLISAAYAMRPAGPAIQRLKAELERGKV